MPSEAETKKDFFTHLARRNPQDVRRLFYLSRKYAWVIVDDDLYKVFFTNNIKTYQCQNGDFTYIYTTSSPLTPEEEDELKLLLGKIFTQVTAIEKNSHFYPEESEFFSNLMLEPVSYDFSSLQMNMGSRNISLQLKVDNFDAYFIKSFFQCPVAERENLERNYHLLRFMATKEAIKNEIWLCVTSGDWKTFALIYDSRFERLQEAISNAHVSIAEDSKNKANDFLYETYLGDTIIKAMWNANPTLNPPFSNDPPNYSNMLSLLLNKAQFDIHRTNTLELLKQQQTSSQYRLFKNAPTPIQTELLASINKHLKAEMEVTASFVSPAA